MSRTPLQPRSERRTIVRDHPDADHPFALVVGARVLASYETEDEARAHDERIRANETRDVEAIQKALPERERRDTAEQYPGAEVELRAGKKGPQIAMWIPFNSPSEEMFGFREVIRPGAFTKTVRESDIVSLWNHDPLWVLGRRSNRTLTIGLSETGAEGVVQLDQNDRMHQHFARRVERRDVTGSSFGFKVVKEKWGTDPEHDEMPLRELLEVRLFDLSPVVFPAYPESDAERRSLLEVVVAKSDGPFDELAAALAAMEDGKVAVQHRDLVQDWITRLQARLPDPAIDPTLELRRRRIAMHERLVQAGAA